MTAQLENGYTRIANELLEGLYKSDLTGQEFRCLVFIIRKTYGYHKKKDRISLSQIADGLGIKTAHVCRVIKRLENRKLIRVDRRYSPTGYSLNKTQLLPHRVITYSPTGEIQKKTYKRNISRASHDSKNKPMEEPTYEACGDDGYTPPKRKTYRYTSKLAEFYCDLVGKTDGSAQLKAAKKILALAEKTLPDETDEVRFKEACDRTKLLKWWYEKQDNPITNWNLIKVAELWDKIINEIYHEKQKYQ